MCGEPFAHFERERESAHTVIHSVALFVKLCFTESFQITFRSYLMKKYELHLTFSIKIILPGPYHTETETVPLHVVPNLAQQARHQLEIVFLRSAFLENADQTSQRDYRPIVIGSRSIGAPLIITVSTKYQLIKSIHVLIELVITNCELGVFWALQLRFHLRFIRRNV